MERYNANLLAHYSFSDALEVFVEAKYVRVDIDRLERGPVLHPGQHDRQFDARERIRLDNPFLDAGASGRRSPIDPGFELQHQPHGGLPEQTSIGTVNAPAFIAGDLTAAQRYAILAGTYRFVIARRSPIRAFATRISGAKPYRVVGGLRGTFNDDWNYEVSANYGRIERDATILTATSTQQRFMLALDAGLDPVTSQIQCRSQFDPASAAAFTQGLPADDGRGEARPSSPPTSPPASPTIRSAPPDNERRGQLLRPQRHGIARRSTSSSSAPSSCGDTSQLLRAAGRSGPLRCSASNIGGRRPSTEADPFVRVRRHQLQRRHPDLRTACVQREGGFRRNPDPAAARHAVLP